jgi:N-acetylglucosaminyldiphosphoundecaprenol N-acetyl-beta-D-mannosaminyltransferase
MIKKELVIVPNFTEILLTDNKCYSFMNFASLTSFFREDQSEMIFYFCDGVLMTAAVQLITGKKVERVSFDYTSIAQEVFSYAVKYGIPLYIIGAEKHELDSFVKKIQKKHKGLIISGSRDGYFHEADQHDAVRSIIASGAKIVVAGLGAGRQERFLSALHQEGYVGVSFSCGGFIRQESVSENQYYPRLVDKLGIRAFYRMYKEPHTISRYMIDYPKNMVLLFFKSATKNLVIKLDGRR